MQESRTSHASPSLVSAYQIKEFGMGVAQRTTILYQSPTGSLTWYESTVATVTPSWVKLLRHTVVELLLGLAAVSPLTQEYAA